jgi:predicted ATPase
MLALYRPGRQAEALEVFAQARRRLDDDLGLDPGPALRRMQHAVLAQDPELDVAAGQVVKKKDRSTVPGTATRLIERRSERLQLDHAWARGRLVTLIGPPGAGKSRLAMEVSRLTEGAVWYISVEQIPAEQIPAEQIPAEQIPAEQIPAEQSVVAAVLDIVAPSSRAMDARQGVVDALSARDGLLVLDACEGRLGEVAGDVEALLSACPGVRVLTTSRELLGLLDEALFPIGPLPEDDAIALLADRACLVAPTFTRAPGDEPSADRLCALVAVLEVVLPPVEAKPWRWPARS